MGRRVDKTGRSKGESRHVRLHHWLMNTVAWRRLGALERATYVEIASRYNGSNNGQIGYSVRDIAEVFGVGKSTAARSFKMLEDTGFIVCATKGGFNRKIRHSTEWRLTEFDCNVTGEIASKAFARWSPSVPTVGQQKQNTVPPQVRTVPPMGPNGTHSGTMEGEKASNGTHSGTVTPELDALSVPVVGHIYSTRGERARHTAGHRVLVKEFELETDLIEKINCLSKAKRKSAADIFTRQGRDAARAFILKESTPGVAT